MTPSNRLRLTIAALVGFSAAAGYCFAATGHDLSVREITAHLNFPSTEARALAPEDTAWSALGMGTNDYVYDLTTYDGKLIAAGAFLNAGGATVGYIAAWDGNSWSPIGTGMNYYVNAVTVFNGMLIAAGSFTEANGSSANRIAQWDGVAWAPLGTGMNGSVYSLAVYGGKLYAGGYFTTAGGNAASSIAVWDGSSWAAVGVGTGGPNPHVYVLAQYDGKLIAGGAFDSAGGIPANGVAAFDGLAWDSLGAGMAALEPAIRKINALAIYENRLIAGGLFSSAGGAGADNIAAWDGSQWSGLGGGVDDEVGALSLLAGKDLIVGGMFSHAGGTAAEKIARWNGTTWSPMGTGMSGGGVAVNALTQYKCRLYVGGAFLYAGGKTASFIASWTPLLVTNTDDAGPGSLREAMEAARRSDSYDTIRFTVSGTIALQGALPPLDGNSGAFADQGVIILGGTAPGGVHSVILDGSALFSGDGLVINSNIGSGGCGSSLIDGLTIRNFPGNGITTIEYPIPVWHTMTNNLIYGNGGLAIDWGNDGVDANDWPDLADPYNHPEIDSVRMNPDSSFFVYGRCTDSAAQIEFYVAHPANDPTRPEDPSGYGEAYSYIGADTSAADKTFKYTISKAVKPFSKISATATLRYDGPIVTSEFCHNFTLIPEPLLVVAYSPVNIIITDPTGKRFGKDSYGNPINEISPAGYFESPHDSVVIYFPLEGSYLIGFVGEVGAPPGATFSSIIRVDGTSQVAIRWNDPVPEVGITDTVRYLVEEGYHYANGDGNRDDRVNVGDAVYIINYVFKHGTPPAPLMAGDANCDDKVNVGDAVKIINYVFKSGDAPCKIAP